MPTITLTLTDRHIAGLAKNYRYKSTLEDKDGNVSDNPKTAEEHVYEKLLIWIESVTTAQEEKAAVEAVKDAAIKAVRDAAKVAEKASITALATK